MTNYYQISRVVFDKKILRVFPIYIMEQKAPPPGGHVFRQINII